MKRIEVGVVVGFNYGWGIVVSSQTHWRAKAMGDETLWTVRYIADDGRVMVCPDSRCDGSRSRRASGCVICSRKLWTDEVRPFSDTDIAHYHEIGMLAKDPFQVPEPGSRGPRQE